MEKRLKQKKIREDFVTMLEVSRREGRTGSGMREEEGAGGERGGVGWEERPSMCWQ